MHTWVGNTCFNVPQVSDNFPSVMHTTRLCADSLFYTVAARGGPDLMPGERGGTKQKEKKSRGATNERKQIVMQQRYYR